MVTGGEATWASRRVSGTRSFLLLGGTGLSHGSGWVPGAAERTVQERTVTACVNQ